MVRVARRSSALQAQPVRVRGMSAKHDLVDWVGGYPFEVAKPEEVFRRIHPLGFELRHLTSCSGGLGCNEYVFELRRIAASIAAMDVVGGHGRGPLQWLVFLCTVRRRGSRFSAWSIDKGSVPELQLH